MLADGRRLPSAVTVWAAGVTASPVAALLGVPLARGGRIPVRADLSLGGHPEVFAIGDIAASPTDDERPLPQVAQPAIQGGFHAAAQIAAQIEGRPTEPFRYHDKGSMATIGRNQAVTEFPSGLRFHGRIGWLMWLGLHLVYLIGFRNRAGGARQLVVELRHLRPQRAHARRVEIAGVAWDQRTVTSGSSGMALTKPSGPIGRSPRSVTRRIRRGAVP